MNYFKKYFFLLSILVFLNSCGNGWSNFKKTMTGEKVTTTDEFLIKKKDPLVLPPEYEKLPLPKRNNKKKNQSSVETALGSSKKEDDNSNTTSTLESTILKELRKKK
jgi:hypothetical protein